MYVCMYVCMYVTYVCVCVCVCCVCVCVCVCCVCLYNTWSPRIPRGPFRPLRTVKPSRTRRPRWSSASVYTGASLWPRGAWREAGTDTDMDRHIVTDITDTDRHTDNEKRAHTHARGVRFPVACMRYRSVHVCNTCECLQHMSGALPCLCVRVFSCRCRLHEVSSADSKPKVPHTLHSAICEAHVRTKQGPTTCLRACTQSCAYAAYSRASSEGVKRERLCHTRRTGRPR